MIDMRPGGEYGSDVQAFVERVMAGVAEEPIPTPARTFVASLRGRSIVDAATAVATAWHLATVSGWRIAPSVRMRSMALVLSVAAVLAIGGSLATAAAVRVVEGVPANQQNVIPNGPGAGEQRPAEPGQIGVEEPGTVDHDDIEPAPEDETDDAAAHDEPEDEDDADEDAPESGDANDADDADRDADNGDAGDADEAEDEADDADEAKEYADEADQDDADEADPDDADEANEDEANEDDADDHENRSGSDSDHEDRE